MVSEKRHMSRPIETVEHHENVDSDGKEASLDSTEVHGFTADQATLQPGYFYSSFFLGTMAATGLGLAAAVGGFGLAAPNLALINNDIGPDPNIVWVSLVYTLTLAVGLILVGRLSDLFGRRVSLSLIRSSLPDSSTSLTGDSGSSSAPQRSRSSDALFAPQHRILVLSLVVQR